VRRAQPFRKPETYQAGEKNMALGSCEHCGETLREENYDEHQSEHHPKWAVAIIKQLERIASALEGMERCA
jgi:hypothetical protein